MRFGMTKEQYQILEDLVIAPLKQNNVRVFIFGSRTNSKQITVQQEYSIERHGLIWI